MKPGHPTERDLDQLGGPPRAAGGRVPTPQGDMIPVKLDNGCAFLPAEAVRKYGPEFLARLNQQTPPRPEEAA